MRFVVIYPNTKEARDAIFGKLIEWSKRVDLENKGISANHFKIVKDWPPKEVLENFPLNLQVEEVEINDDKLFSTRKLVLDIEIAVQEEKKEIIVVEPITIESTTIEPVTIEAQTIPELTPTNV